MGAPELLAGVVLLVLVGLLIVPTFYGLWRAARTAEWGWFAGIIGGWIFGFGWVVGLIFLLGPDRRFRAEVSARTRQLLGEGEP